MGRPTPLPRAGEAGWAAAKLTDVLAGESPVGENYPVTTVVISGDGEGDQAVGSPEVKVSMGGEQLGRS